MVLTFDPSRVRSAAIVVVCVPRTINCSASGKSWWNCISGARVR